MKYGMNLLISSQTEMDEQFQPTSQSMVVKLAMESIDLLLYQQLFHEWR